MWRFRERAGCSIWRGPIRARSKAEIRRGAYRLDLRNHTGVDAEEFRSAAEVALAEAGGGRTALLDRARSPWTGQPLPEERTTDWATAYRERLIDRYIAVLSALIEVRARAADHAGAADLARELVDIDPLNEGAHRALIVAYARSRAHRPRAAAVPGAPPRAGRGAWDRAVRGDFAPSGTGAGRRTRLARPR